MNNINQNQITIRCRECKWTVVVDRQPEDPKSAVLMEDWCPECIGGGFSDPSYYGADGKELDLKEYYQ